jgi:hypothetical protein
MIATKLGVGSCCGMPNLREELLLSDGAVPVVPSAFTEVVTHHALGKQKKDDCQDDRKQQTPNSEPGWLSPCGARRIQIICHQSCFSGVGSTTAAAL